MNTSDPSSLAVTSSIAIAAESLSRIVPVAVSLMFTELAGAVASTMFPMFTVNVSVASATASSGRATVN